MSSRWTAPSISPSPAAISARRRSHGWGACPRSAGFLRLWTLKEAFIKATGLGLSQELDGFWFQVFPPAIRFKDIADNPAAWRFEQRDLDGKFMAAVGFRAPPGQAPLVTWWQVEPDALSATVDPSAPISRRPVNSVVGPMS